MDGVRLVRTAYCHTSVKSHNHWLTDLPWNGEHSVSANYTIIGFQKLNQGPSQL
jgi:hypothetical protein